MPKNDLPKFTKMASLFKLAYPVYKNKTILELPTYKVRPILIDWSKYLRVFKLKAFLKCLLYQKKNTIWDTTTKITEMVEQFWNMAWIPKMKWIITNIEKLNKEKVLRT